MGLAIVIITVLRFICCKVKHLFLNFQAKTTKNLEATLPTRLPTNKPAAHCLMSVPPVGMA
jgi:hypothetical protein